LRALLVLGHQQPLARGIEVGFERDNSLVGGGQPFVEPAIFFAQRLVFTGLLREALLQLGDLGTAGGDIDGDLGLGGLGRAQQALRGGELLAQRLAFLVGRRRLLLQFGDFVAQLAVGGAGIVEHRLQADLFRLLGLEGAQGLTERIGQLANRGLDGVELADLGIGIEHQVAQRLVVAADLGAERGEQLLVEFERIVGLVGGIGGAHGRGLGRIVEQAGLAGEKAPEFAHSSDPCVRRSARP
jgi:hypothetical protein